MATRRQASPRPADPPAVRFEALVVPGERRPSLDDLAALDLDRVPDPDGAVRVLVSADEAADLVERGYEVRVLRAHRVAPLDPALVLDDESAIAWLEVRVQGLDRPGGS